MTPREAKLFDEIIRKYNSASPDMFPHNHYEVMGLIPRGEYNSSKYDERYEYIRKEIIDRSALQNAQKCLHNAKTVLSNPQRKDKYDEDLMARLKGDLIFRIEAAAADLNLDPSERQLIEDTGRSFGFSNREIDQIIEEQKVELGFREGAAQAAETEELDLDLDLDFTTQSTDEGKPSSERMALYILIISSVLSAITIVFVFMKVSFSFWAIAGLILSAVAIAWGGWYFYMELKEFLDDSDLADWPDFDMHLVPAAGLILLLIISWQIFLLLAAIPASWFLARWIFGNYQWKKYISGSISMGPYLLFWILSLSLGVLKAPVEESGASMIQEPSATQTEPEQDSVYPVAASLSIDQTGHEIFPSEETEVTAPDTSMGIHTNQEISSDEQIMPETSKKNKIAQVLKRKREIKPKLIRNSENRKNLIKLFTQVSRGNINNAFEYITEESTLNLLLYKSRFCGTGRLIYWKHYPQFKLKSIREYEYAPEENSSYFIFEFAVKAPSKPRNDFDESAFINSLSPWVERIGVNIFRDSIMIRNGYIDFNYGRDKGLYWLDEVQRAQVNVDWLNVRKSPSLDAEIVGKLKPHDSGEWYETSEIYETALQDYNYELLVAHKEREAGFVKCLIVDEQSGTYFSGHLWEEYLDINEYIYN